VGASLRHANRRMGEPSLRWGKHWLLLVYELAAVGFQEAQATPLAAVPRKLPSCQKLGIRKGGLPCTSKRPWGQLTTPLREPACAPEVAHQQDRRSLAYGMERRV